jgi:glycosyltransferase involved in cell wall biosynthesis
MNTKVAIIGSRGYPSSYSGFETLVRRLAPFLAENGCDVSVYCRDPALGLRCRQDTFGNVRRIFTPGWDSKTGSTLTYGLTSCMHASRSRYDVALVLNVANGLFLPMLRRNGVVCAVNVDGLEWKRAKWNRLGKEVFILGAKASARWADRIVIDSEALRETWGGEFPVDAKFIPYGADVVETVDSERIRRMELVPGSYILCVARLVPENNLDVLLDALEYMPEEQPVVVVGSGVGRSALVDRLQRVVAARSNVRWLGHISDQDILAALWANCGAYWHGHSVGGTNPSLLQALGYGSPTLALNTRFNCEVLSQRGMQLLPSEPRELARRLQELIQNPLLAQEFSRAGKEIVSDRYCWTTVCKAYLALVKELASCSASQQC